MDCVVVLFKVYLISKLKIFFLLDILDFLP